MVLVQCDDRAAYEQLFTRWSPPLFRFLGRRTGALEQAEEAHQETWLRVYRWRKRYDPKRPFRPWIYTLAANAGRDAMRPQPALFRLPAQGGGTQAARDALASDAELDRAAQTGLGLGQLEEALRGLVARRRVLVVDACFSGTHRSRWSRNTRDTVGGMRSGRAPAPAAYEISRYDARLYSAHYDQPAMEDPSLQNGVYTHFLVQALAGSGDADGDGLVDVLEAHLFALDRTLGFTEGAQVPWLHTTQVGRDTIIISGDPTQRVVAEQALLWGGPDPRGQQLRVDGWRHDDAHRADDPGRGAGRPGG